MTFSTFSARSSRSSRIDLSSERTGAVLHARLCERRLLLPCPRCRLWSPLFDLMSAMSSASTANFSSADFEDFELSAASDSRVAFVPAICRKYSTSARPRTDGARLSTSSRKSKLCCAGIGSRGARGLDAVRLADLERGEACAPLYRAVDTDSVVEVAVQSSMSIIPNQGI